MPSPSDSPTAGDSTTRVSERRVQVTAVLVTLFGALPVWLTGALAVQIGRDITLGPARLGLASGAFFGAAALSSTVMGRAAESIGPRAAMRLAVAGSTLAMLVLAAAPVYAAILCGLIAAGAINALAQVAANLFVATGVRPEKLGWSLALKQAGVPGGTLLGGLAVPLLGATVGWRWGYVVGAAGALGAVALVPRDGPVADRPPRRRGVRPDLPASLLVGLAVAVGFATAANGSLATFVVSTGVETGLGESAAGLVLTFGSAAGITTRLLAGRRADRRTGGHLPIVAALLLGGTLGYVLLAPGRPATHVVGAAVAFGSGWAWPGLFNLAVVRLNPGGPAAATGVTQTGVYVGALGGPIAFGGLVDAFGYGTAWSCAAASSVVGAVGVMAARRAIVRSRRSAAPTSVSAVSSPDEPAIPEDR